MSTKCPKNVGKMSEKCPKIVQKMSENTIFGHFLDNFCLFGRCLCLVTLSNACPLQTEFEYPINLKTSAAASLSKSAQNHLGQIVQVLRSLQWLGGPHPQYSWDFPEEIHEDGNGENLTVKKWWLFGCRFFTVYAEFFTVYKGRKR